MSADERGLVTEMDALRGTVEGLLGKIRAMRGTDDCKQDWDMDEGDEKVGWDAVEECVKEGRMVVDWLKEVKHDSVKENGGALRVGVTVMGVVGLLVVGVGVWSRSGNGWQEGWVTWWGAVKEGWGHGVVRMQTRMRWMGENAAVCGSRMETALGHVGDAVKTTWRKGEQWAALLETRLANTSQWRATLHNLTTWWHAAGAHARRLLQR